jgi:outer membrane cobalamin receptor
MKKVFFVVVGILVAVSTIAQERGQGRMMNMDPSKMPKVGTIYGKIVDEYDDSPVPYANIAIYRMKDSTLVSGAISDKDGNFEIKELTYGMYYLEGKFIGYHKGVKSGIKITPKETTTNIGTLKIKQSTTNIKGVEITAEKMHMEYKIDRKVININQDLMASGGSAVQALENIPSVQVDIEGNVSLRGSGNFTVLIDGRPSVLSGTDALEQIPSSSIENIEIITNPSAKYDPEGIAGIINIVSKKNKLQGISGILNTTIGTGDKYSADLNIAYRTKKVNLFLGANYDDRNYTGGGNAITKATINDTVTVKDNQMTHGYYRGGWNVELGTDLYINPSNTLTLSGNLGGSNRDRGRDFKINNYTVPETIFYYSTSESSSPREGNHYKISGNYQHKFKKNERVIDIYVNYSKRTTDEVEEQFEYYADANYNSLNDPLYFTETTEDEDNKDFRAKIDYSGKIGSKSKLEAGAQTRIDDETEIYRYSYYDTTSSIWINDSKFNNTVDFYREIHSVYSTISGESKIIDYQLGLRGEYTKRKTDQLEANSNFTLERFDFFPTLHFSKKINKNNQIMASYAKRIDRPRGWFLDPFVSYMNSNNKRQGNPELEPEYIDSYELAFQRRLKIATVSLEGYYRKNKNKITRIRTLQDDGMILHTFENLNNDNSLGAELFVNFNTAKWLMLTVSGTYYKYWLEGDIIEQGAETESNNFDFRINSMIKLPKDFRFQFNTMYRGPSISAQGTSAEFVMMSTAIRKDFFNGKLSGTLKWQNMFGLMKHEFTQETSNLYSYMNMQREPNMFMFSLSYKFNNYQRERKINGNESMDFDEGGSDF